MVEKRNSFLSYSPFEIKGFLYSNSKTQSMGQISDKICLNQTFFFEKTILGIEINLFIRDFNFFSVLIFFSVLN